MASPRRHDVRLYSVAALNAATGNFEASGYLGNGFFGAVYKGMLDGVAVAIKRMGTAHRTAEMRRERERCATLTHSRLLPCLGMVRARASRRARQRSAARLQPYRRARVCLRSASRLPGSSGGRRVVQLHRVPAQALRPDAGTAAPRR